MTKNMLTSHDAFDKASAHDGLTEEDGIENVLEESLNLDDLDFSTDPSNEALLEDLIVRTTYDPDEDLFEDNGDDGYYFETTYIPD